MDTWEVVADHSGATASEFHGLPFALIVLAMLYCPLKNSLSLPNKKTSVFPVAENEGFQPTMTFISHSRSHAKGIGFCDKTRLLAPGFQPTLPSSSDRYPNDFYEFRSRLQRRDRARISRASVCFTALISVERTIKPKAL